MPPPESWLLDPAALRQAELKRRRDAGFCFKCSMATVKDVPVLECPSPSARRQPTPSAVVTAGGSSPGPRRGGAASRSDHNVPAGPRTGARHHPGLGLDLQSRPALPVPSGRSGRRRTPRLDLGTLAAVSGAARHTRSCAHWTRGVSVWSRPHPPTSKSAQQWLPTSLPHRRDAVAACRRPWARLRRRRHGRARRGRPPTPASAGSAALPPHRSRALWVAWNFPPRLKDSGQSEDSDWADCRS